ncbi:MAG: invasion associated locus B family protein [Pseudomonadota bacterium]
MRTVFDTLAISRVTLATCAVLALGLSPFNSAMAQDDTPIDTAEEEAPDPLALSRGEPVGEEGGVGSTYILEEHGDWEIRCLVAPEGQTDPCQLYQLLVDETGNPTAEFNLFVLPEGDDVTAGATVVTPLDTLLSAQMRMRVDDGQTLRFPFSFCQPIGCFVRLGLSEDDVDVFKAGGEATITIVPLPAPDQTVDLTLSLSGFTAGMDALELLPAPEQQ